MSNAVKSSETSAYYTVPEFAEKAGVSKQAVYDRIKKDLSGYTMKQNGKTMISASALAYVGTRDDGQVKIQVVSELDQVKSSQSIKTINQESQLEQSSKSNQPAEMLTILTDPLEKTSSVDAKNRSSQEKEPSESIENQSSQSSGSSLLDYLMAENARLLFEIERKDRVIAEKDDAIKGYSDRIIALAEQFAALAEREQEISSKALSTTGQAQLLHAMAEQTDVSLGSSEILSSEGEGKKKLPWWKRKGK